MTMAAQSRTRGLLPSRVAITSDEALDCYLERLAAANGIGPAQLMRLLTEPGVDGTPSAAFMMSKPDPLLTNRIAELGGLSKPSLETATLMRYDNRRPLQLSGLEPTRRDSFRQVVMQGWFPQFGSQACPQCLATDGIWRLPWRLPIVAVCPVHATFLVPRCAGCGMRFRTGRHSPLRPQLGWAQPCGNSLGLRNPCQHSALNHSTEAAPESITGTAETVTRAIAGQPVAMLGGLSDPETYLSEVRHLSTLLLHLLSHRDATAFVDWADELRREADERRTPRRGPRWGVSPPQSARVRGHALSEAHQILRASNLVEAGVRLAPWLTLIADGASGPRGWLLNRTTRTPTIERLVDAATADRHHVGRRLDRRHVERTLEPSAIPQLIDLGIYREIFGDMLGGYEWTGQLYVSLCVVRSASSAASWRNAAVHLGMDPDFGLRAARAASNRMRVSSPVFADAVERLVRALPADRDFRHRESRVRALAREPTAWHAQWRTSVTPARRQSSLPFAITWMWCEVAQGALDTSPAWSGLPTRASKVAYRAFREKLPSALRDSLRSMVLPD
jgi:hypothetical protein